MNCLELVIIIFALGFVSMIEICAIATCVGKVLDQKMKAKAKIELVTFEKEMEIFTNTITECIDVFMDRTRSEIKQPKPNFTNYRDYNEVGYSPVKPVAEKKNTKKKTIEEELDF